MKLIIDINEEKYRHITEMPNVYGSEICEVIRNGTPLPKGHGRLIDADALPLNDIDDANYGSNYIRMADTIIEADKEADNE